jgi:hypothetical protein
MRRLPPIGLAKVMLAAAGLAACAQQPPVLLTLQDQTVAANQTLSFDVAATDPDTDQLSFAFSPAAKGAELTQIEGKLAKFSWTPNPAQAGLTTLTFEVTDGDGTDTETINVRVTSEGEPELLSPDLYAFDPAVTTEVRFSLQWKAMGGGGLVFDFDPNPTSWGAKLAVRSNEIDFTWKPTAEQKRTNQHLFAIRAVDTEGHSATRTISIVFEGAPTAGLCDPCTTGVDCDNGLSCQTFKRTVGATTKHCMSATCTATTSNPKCTCGELVINEVLADPPSSCADGTTTCSAKVTVDVNGDGVRESSETKEEFVEIVNVSARKISLKEIVLQVDGAPKYTFASGELTAGASVVVFGGGPESATKRQYAAKGLSLVNSQGSVSLVVADRTLDSVTWSKAASEQSFVRQPEGEPGAPLSGHKSAAGSKGAYSPWTRADGKPFLAP